MNQRQRKPVEGALPLDESWWGSLLTDEDRYLERFEDRYPPYAEPAAHSPARRSAEILSSPKSHSSYQYASDCGPAAITVEAGENIAPPNWERVQYLFDADQSLTVHVSSYNRGGLLVEAEDMHGFVPISHLVDLNCEVEEGQRDEALSAYLDQTLDVKVIECDPARGRVVFSERAALASAGRRNQLLNELQPGECVEGLVTNITDFGVFVDLGGVEGLVHVSEISWGRVRHPTDLLKVGDTVTAFIIQVDRDRSRIALSLKRLCSNPWDQIDLRYHTGQVVGATVTSLAAYGAFARLEDGLDGLIHLSEMGPTVSAPNEVVQEGQQVTVRILNIDAQRQRLGLSLVVD